MIYFYYCFLRVQHPVGVRYLGYILKILELRFLRMIQFYFAVKNCFAMFYNFPRICHRLFESSKILFKQCCVDNHNATSLGYVVFNSRPKSL